MSTSEATILVTIISFEIFNDPGSNASCKAHHGMNVLTRRIDSRLGTWVHGEWRPPAGHPLAGLVELVWDFEGCTVNRRERVFPNGAVELIVQLDDRYHDIDDATARLTPAVCVTGIQTGPMLIEAPPQRCRVLGVRLHPHGAWALLRHPLAELTGLTADLRELLGPSAADLADRCHDADIASERIHCVLEWLSGRLQRSASISTMDATVRSLADRIVAAGGAVRIGDLRDRSGLSTGRLAAAFLERVGVTPKRYARILRFRRALGMLHTGTESLSDIAFRCGFYDQAHMNADFRAFAGLTPRQFRDARRYPASISTAEG